MRALLLAAITLFLLLPQAALGQPADGEPLRIIAFGAHPDDCELNAGGVAAQWAEAGHEVKFVSMTNGDIGHFEMAGGPLAQRRMQEVEACADRLGIETEVLDIHDGELMPTLENRRTVARLIRDWQADVVMVHRRYDYHADHRYSGVLVDDAIILVNAPFFTPDTPPLERSPVVLYYHDNFERPYPFEPSIVVSIDESVDQKRECLEQMPSQFRDEHSWQASIRENVPEDPDERMAYILDDIMSRYEAQADAFRDRLIELYGEERGQEIRHAESFELSQYGRQATEEELKALFPSFE